MITKIEKYGATWCNPCKMLDKTLQDLPGTIELIKYDADEHPELFEEKKIRNVPVLIYYNENNEEVTRTVGSVTLNKILEIIE